MSMSIYSPNKYVEFLIIRSAGQFLLVYSNCKKNLQKFDKLGKINIMKLSQGQKLDDV